MKNVFLKASVAITLLTVISCEKQAALEESNPSLSISESQNHSACASHQVYLDMLKKNPSIEDNTFEIEEFTKKTISSKSFRSAKETEEEITIPVVVHVVYNSDEENIKWRQVKSQIDVLNKDFNKENEDIINVPNFFKKRVADVGIRFELKRITRTKTNVVAFEDDYSTTDRNEQFNIALKEYGGKNGWDTSKYLNIWVGNFGCCFAGFALNPAIAKDFPKLDGVYIDYRKFGSTDIAAENFSLGRTAVHEVGHWLNLLHLSGIVSSCRDDDHVSDTPKQAYEYVGEAPYPETKSCNTSDMTMNFMQSVNDDYMIMFTEGQKDRMLAMFEPGGIRASFKK